MSEVNTLSEHKRMPDPMERMEVECVREADERSIISSRLSVPLDVIERRGEVSDAESIIVKESNVSDWVDRDIPNPACRISYAVEDLI